MTNSTTTPAFQFITNAKQAKDFQYIIMGISKAGKHINYAFTSKYWNSAIEDYVNTANGILARLDNDTLASVMMVSSDHLINPAYQVILNNGLNVTSDLTKLINKDEVCNTHDLEIKNTHCAEPQSQRDFMINSHKHTHLMTVINDLGMYSATLSAGFGSQNLAKIRKQITKTNKQHGANISLVLLSLYDNDHHNAIIERLEKTQQRWKPSELESFINNKAVA